MPSNVLYETSRSVATITLNRPERLNGITATMLRELSEVLHRIARDPELKVVVLTGAGTGFCAGVDVKYVASGEADIERGKHGPGDPSVFQLPVLLHEMPQITLAAINGACAGAGLGWACACDLRVAAESAKFNTAFLERGLPGDMSLPWTLSRIVGSAKARELSFLPGKFDAVTALRIGLVSEVYPDVAFRDSLGGLVDQLSQASTVALRGLKANYLAAERMGLTDYSDYEGLRHNSFRQGNHFREAFITYVEQAAASKPE